VIHVIVFNQDDPGDEAEVEQIQGEDDLFDDSVYYHGQDDTKYFIGVDPDNVYLLQQRFPGRQIIVSEEEVPWDSGPCYRE